MASAGAEIMAPPPKVRLREKDPLQQQVFNAQVNNFAQNAFITGVNQLGMSLDVSNCLKRAGYHLFKKNPLKTLF